MKSKIPLINTIFTGICKNLITNQLINENIRIL